MSESQTNELINDMVEKEPTINEEIIDAISKKEESGPIEGESKAEPNPVPQSSSNVVVQNSAFDPSIHEVDGNGNPRLTKDGKFRRKRGRANVNKSTNESGIGVSSGGIDSKPVGMDFTATGKMFAGIMFGGFQAVFDSEEWEPNNSERSQIENATVKYCESQNIADIPPGIALVLCVGMYALPRLAMPNTREKLKKYGRMVGIVKPEMKQTQPIQPITPISNIVHTNGIPVGNKNAPIDFRTN